MKKVTKTTYHTANLLLPLSETARFFRAIKYSGQKLTERARQLRQEKHDAKTEVLSFDEAVSASGLSREKLISRHLTAKRLYLLIFWITMPFSLIFPVALLFSEIPFSWILLSRVLATAFMLAVFGALMFVQALKNQYRLWQLQSRQLGIFSEWKATGHWLRDIFSWQVSSRTERHFYR